MGRDGVKMDGFLVALLLKPFLGFAFVVALFLSARFIAWCLRPILPASLYRTAADAESGERLIDHRTILGREAG